MSAAGIYVHIPFCRSKCRYCDFVSVCEGEEKQRRYISALLREIYTGRKIYSGVADTLYIGGGTPSCLYSGAVANIATALKKSFDVRISEFTVECNPDTFDEDKAEELKNAGVTRISLGVQSLDDAVLRSIGRRHDSAAAKKAVKLAVKKGFDVSADLMLGLVGQGKNDVEEFASFISAEGVEHVSAYMLKVEDATPLARDVERGLVLPSDDECAEMYDYTRELLGKEGFARYETSNFCKNGKECRHNLKYWTMQDYLAFGAAAHGKTGKKRYFNTSDVNEYIRALENGCHKYLTEEIMSDEDELSEYMMLGLRLERGINVKETEKRFGICFEERFSEALSKAAPYIDFEGDVLKIRPSYALVANGIINMFLD